MTRALSIWTVPAAVALLVACGASERPEDAGGGAAEAESEPRRVRPRLPLGSTMEYTVRFPEPHTHYLEVETVVPTDGDPEVELFMAVWTPGSYLVREYARHVEDVEAATVEGQELQIDKSRKNRWRVRTTGAQRIVLRYRVYARELSVRTSFVDEDIAILNGAPTFITRRDDRRRQHDVLLEPAEGWTHSVTGLDPHPDGQPHHYLASSYDELVDSPIVLGDPTLHEMEVGGAPHVLANFGEGDLWDGERSASDVRTLVETQLGFWGEVPYERYVFLNVLTEGGGGLEHEDSTLMLASPWRTRTREDYLGWLGLVSHEFFHTWNGKRLRPIGLGPFEYESEVYTRSLWIVEGITSYYDDLLLRRSGLMTQDEYLERLSKSIGGLQETPGRQVQSLTEASYDAWIKYYRADENFVNTGISYYRKGAVVAFLLDALIRRQSGGDASLDDVMRLAYERYGGERGYTPSQFRAVASEVGGASLDEFFAAAVDSTEELDYGPALDWFGLERAEKEEEPTDEPEELPGYLGVTAADRGGRLVVTEIPRGTPAHGAGINVDDELIAIGDHRISQGGLGERLARYRPGDEVSVLVARRGELRRIDVTLGEAPDESWEITVAEMPTAAQRRHLESWLTSGIRVAAE